MKQPNKKTRPDATSSDVRERENRIFSLCELVLPVAQANSISNPHINRTPDARRCPQINRMKESTTIARPEVADRCVVRAQSSGRLVDEIEKHRSATPSSMLRFVTSVVCAEASLDPTPSIANGTPLILFSFRVIVSTQCATLKMANTKPT